MPLPTILVFGATGTQGGAVCRHLSRRGDFKVIAVTRDPRTQEANRVAALPGVEPVRCDADDPDELEGVFSTHAPLHGVFSVQANDYTTEGCEKEIAQGKRVVDLCEKYAVPHLVYSSVAQLRPADLPDVATKIEIEAHLRAGKTPFTVLRPTFFMDNFFANRYAFASRTAVGYPGFHTANPVKQQYIYVDDLGMIAARVFAESDSWIGRTLELAGDSLTPSELVAVFAEHNGQPISALEIPADHWGSEIEPLFVGMRDGLWDRLDIEALRREFPSLHTVASALRHSGYRPPEDQQPVD